MKKETQPEGDKSLAHWRKEIDKVDRKIIQLLAKRFEITEKVGIYKAENNLPSYDPIRENNQIQTIENLAKHFGLEPLIAQEIFTLIRNRVKERHEEINRDSNPI